MLYVFYGCIMLALISWVVFSFRARRATDPTARGLNGARVNLSMGALLILASIVQFILFEPDTVRIIVGAAFLLLGLFNVFAGLRNHAYYRRQLPRQ